MPFFVPRLRTLILLSRIRKDLALCRVLAMHAPLTLTRILSDRSRPPPACRRGRRGEHRRARRLGHVPRRSKAAEEAGDEEAQGRLADGTVGVGIVQQLHGRGGVASVTSGSCRRCCKCCAMTELCSGLPPFRVCVGDATKIACLVVV